MHAGIWMQRITQIGSLLTLLHNRKVPENGGAFKGHYSYFNFLDPSV
jgi:hypothetical protein